MRVAALEAGVTLLGMSELLGRKTGERDCLYANLIVLYLIPHSQVPGSLQDTPPTWTWFTEGS